MQATLAVAQLVKKYPTSEEPKNWKIWDSHGSTEEDSSLLGCYDMSTGKQ
jgi:hypothetical protein